MVGLLARHQWWWTPIIAGAVVAVGAWVLIDAMDERAALFDELSEAVDLERERTGQVLALRDEVEAARASGARLEEQVAVLIEQVLQLGGEPVVIIHEDDETPDAGENDGKQGPRGPRGPKGERGPPGERNKPFCPVPMLCLPLVVFAALQ